MAWEQPWTSDTRTHACNCKWRAVVRRGFFATAIAIATAVVLRKQQLKIHWIKLFFVWPKKEDDHRNEGKKIMTKKTEFVESITKAEAKTTNGRAKHNEKYLYHCKWLCWSFRQMKTIILANCREREKNLCENEFPLNLNLSHTHTDAHTDTKTRTHVRLAV